MLQTGGNFLEDDFCLGRLKEQIWGAAGHYFGSFSLPRTQGGSVLFTPTRRFHTEPHMWRLISQQRMSIELPLALCTRRSVADGMVVGTISMKVGQATLRTQARVVTEAGKAEVSRGAKLAMEIRRLGENKSQAMLMYLVAMVAAMVGITYAAVPLYRKFCQATGYGGTIQRREVCTFLYPRGEMPLYLSYVDCLRVFQLFQLLQSSVHA